MASCQALVRTRCVPNGVRSRQTVVCSAASSRRAFLSNTVLLQSLVLAPSALALIIDEEDPELIEKAKASRKSRLAQQKETTRAFIQDEGISDKKLDQELISLQKGVYKLAQSGSQLESGDLQAVSRSLSESWVVDFEKALVSASTNDKARSSSKAIVDGIADLKTAAKDGNVGNSKKTFVAVVSAIQGWISDAGVSGSLKSV